MKDATMLYKCPGPHPIHGGNYDTLIVDEDDIEEAMGKGWHLTTPAAKAAHDAEGDGEEDKPATYAELKQKAAELGLTFTHNVSRAALTEMIEQALAKG